MSELQRMREKLETALSHATTRHQEREIGRAIVELQEAADFGEFAELQRPAVQLPPDVSLPSILAGAECSPTTLQEE